MEQKAPRDKYMIKDVIGMPWRHADGRWTADKLEVGVDLVPPPLMPSDGVRVPRGRITKQDVETHGATLACPGCNAIKRGKTTSTFRPVSQQS